MNTLAGVKAIVKKEDRAAVLIVLSAFVLRWVGITHPPLEINHSWRQALTNMIARNYLETGYQFFFPQVDLAGNLSGIIGSEMPFFNTLIYGVSLVFGYEHWYGRIINLMVSSAGLWFFYKLVKELHSKKLALYALGILTVSIWFTFSRKIMPDTFSIALMIIGMYCALQYLTTEKMGALGLFFIFGLLAVGTKLPAVGWFSALILLFWSKHKTALKIHLILAAGFNALIAYGWYFFWVPYLVETYGYQLFFPKTLSQGFTELADLLPDLAERFYFSAHYSFVAFASVLLGLIFAFKNASKKYIYLIFAVSFTYGLFIVKTGEVFPTHNYYIIPIVPFMAISGGYFLMNLPKKWGVVLMAIIAVESLANQQHDFFIKDNQWYKLKLEAIAKSNVAKEELIIINGGNSPQQIYFTNRKGWTVLSEQITPHFIDSLHSQGAQKLILNQRTIGAIDLKYNKVYKGDDFFVYDLD